MGAEGGVAGKADRAQIRQSCIDGSDSSFVVVVVLFLFFKHASFELVQFLNCSFLKEV